MKDIRKDIEVIFEEIEDNITDFSLEQIEGIKKRVGMLESAIKSRKDKKKVKTVSVSEDIHTSVKKFCAENELKMGEWVEKVLMDSINPTKK